MNRALLFLLRLQIRGWFRRLFRGARTFKGLIFVLCAAGFLAISFLPLAFDPQRIGAGGIVFDAAPGAPFQRFGPLGLFLLTLMTLLASTRHRGIYFNAAEIDLLFPAPFGRRELIGYRFLLQASQNLASVVFMSLFLWRHLHSFLHGIVGLFLSFQFLALAQQATSLLAGSVGERLLRLGRWAAGGLLAAALLAAAAAAFSLASPGGFLAGVDRLLSFAPVQWLLFPFRVYSEMLGSADLGRFLAWTAGAAAINAALIGAILVLDIDYRDAALETSQRIQARLARLRGGRLTASSERKLHLSIPCLPRLGGIGPIFWRHVQELVRESPATLYLVLIFAAGSTVPAMVFAANDVETRHALGPLLPFVIFSPLILSNWFRFDFRGDLDRIERLLTLPVPPAALAIGQVLLPAVLIGALQTLGFAVLLVLNTAGGPATRNASVEAAVLICPIGIALAMPASFLVIALENLIFLLYPTRFAPGAGADFQNLGRVILAFFLKLVVLGLVALAGAPLIWTAYRASGGSGAAATFAAALYLIAASGVMVWLLGRVFARFDVSAIPTE